MDRPDTATREAVNSALETLHQYKVYTHEWTHADLALSRNKSIDQCQGTFVALLDGDDLWAPNWLNKSIQYARTSPDTPQILHPQYNVYFGRGNQYIFEHIDSSSRSFSADYARHANCWTALSFAKRSHYLEYPYRSNQIDKGFGYEDWTWNVQLLEAGFRHVVIYDTAHFIRQNNFGSSLSDRTRRQKAVPRVRALYKAA